MADFDINPFETIKENHENTAEVRYYATYRIQNGTEVRLYKDVEDIELTDELIKISEFDVYKTQEEAKAFLDLEDIKS